MKSNSYNDSFRGNRFRCFIGKTFILLLSPNYYDNYRKRNRVFRNTVPLLFVQRQSSLAVWKSKFALTATALGNKMMWCLHQPKLYWKLTRKVCPKMREISPCRHATVWGYRYTVEPPLFSENLLAERVSCTTFLAVAAIQTDFPECRFHTCVTIRTWYFGGSLYHDGVAITRFIPHCPSR